MPKPTTMNNRKDFFMKQDKNIAQHYFKTGILGAYETAAVENEIQSGDKIAPCFDDSFVDFGQNRTVVRRTMDVGGRRFSVCSVFPSNAPSTPTDKILTLIDLDLRKQ